MLGAAKKGKSTASDLNQISKPLNPTEDEMKLSTQLATITSEFGNAKTETNSLKEGLVAALNVVNSELVRLTERYIHNLCQTHSNRGVDDSLNYQLLSWECELKSFVEQGETLKIAIADKTAFHSSYETLQSCLNSIDQYGVNQVIVERVDSFKRYIDEKALKYRLISKECNADSNISLAYKINEALTVVDMSDCMLKCADNNWHSGILFKLKVGFNTIPVWSGKTNKPVKGLRKDLLDLSKRCGTSELIILNQGRQAVKTALKITSQLIDANKETVLGMIQPTLQLLSKLKAKVDTIKWYDEVDCCAVDNDNNNQGIINRIVSVIKNIEGIQQLLLNEESVVVCDTKCAGRCNGIVKFFSGRISGICSVFVTGDKKNKKEVQRSRCPADIANTRTEDDLGVSDKTVAETTSVHSVSERDEMPLTTIKGVSIFEFENSKSV